MKYKLLVVVLCLAMIFCALSLTACDKEETPEPQKSILFLGDSIGEAVAGVSPIQDRANCGYYGIIGQINGFKYDNRAISGNQTKDLLSFITRDTEDANLVNTLIKQADIIHVSILGNDLLQYNFSTMLLEIVAQAKYGDGYVNEQTVKDFHIYHNGSFYRDANGDEHPITPGYGLTTFNRCLTQAATNIEAIVSHVKSQNPDVTLIFQNVYNPVDGESELISNEMLADLLTMDAKYDFTTESGVAEVRALGNYMLGALGKVLTDYQSAHPDTIHIVDALTAFDNIYNADMQRGKNLIFCDGVHPSSEGHAVLASLIQAKLEELGLASKHALDNYKELRLNQLIQMYSGATNGSDTFDIANACLKLAVANSFDSVAKTYFALTEDYTPSLYSDPTANRVTNGVAAAKKTVYQMSSIQIQNLTLSEDEQQSMTDIANLAILLFKTKAITLNTDNTMSLTLSANIGSLLGGVVGLSGGSFSIDGMIVGGKEEGYFVTESGKTGTKAMGNLDLVDLLKFYLERMFPGIDMDGGNVGSSLSLIKNSIGLSVDGIDSLIKEPYTDTVGLPLYDGGVDASTVNKVYNSYLDYLLAYVSRYSAAYDSNGTCYHVRRLPDGLTDKLTELKTLTISLNCVYSLVTVKGSDGTEYKAVYMGQYDKDTSPWLILTEYEDENQVKHLRLRIEILGVTVNF